MLRNIAQHNALQVHSARTPSFTLIHTRATGSGFLPCRRCLSYSTQCSSFFENGRLFFCIIITTQPLSLWRSMWTRRSKPGFVGWFHLTSWCTLRCTCKLSFYRTALNILILRKLMKDVRGQILRGVARTQRQWGNKLKNLIGWNFAESKLTWLWELCLEEFVRNVLAADQQARENENLTNYSVWGAVIFFLIVTYPKLKIEFQDHLFILFRLAVQIF